MLCKYKHYLSNKSIILGSSSAQRKRILKENLGLEFEVLKSNFEEDLDKSLFKCPEDYVEQTCRGKVDDILMQLKERKSEAEIVICADTVISHEGKIFEKPRDRDHAMRMLSALAGKEHKVLTAFTISMRGEEWSTESFVEATQVTFHDLSASEIAAYVETGDPFGKSGGYGLQSLGSSLVRNLNGCYFNVMGFPAYRFSLELTRMIEKCATPVGPIQVSCLDEATMAEMGKLRYDIWKDEGFLDESLFPNGKWLEAMDYGENVVHYCYQCVNPTSRKVEMVAAARATRHLSLDDDYRDVVLWKSKGLALELPVVDFGRLCVKKAYRRQGLASGLNKIRFDVVKERWQPGSIVCTASSGNKDLLIRDLGFKDIGVEVTFKDRPNTVFHALQK